MEKNQIKHILKPHLPEASINDVVSLMINHQVYLRITRSRSSKYGDFRVPARGQQPKLSINYNLNSYAFLITLLHEMAHLLVWQKYQQIYRQIKPHGSQWKNEFKALMMPFLKPEIFPDTLLLILKKHMLNPKASSSSDLALMKELRKFDHHNIEVKLLSDLSAGDVFLLKNQEFKIIKKNRTRFLCENLSNKRRYLIHSLAEINLPE